MLFTATSNKTDSSMKTTPGLIYPSKPLDSGFNDRGLNTIPIERKGNSPFGQSFSYTDHPQINKEFGRNNFAGK